MIVKINDLCSAFIKIVNDDKLSNNYMRILTYILSLVYVSTFAIEVTPDTYSQWYERALNGDSTAQYMLGYYWDKKGGYVIYKLNEHCR